MSQIAAPTPPSRPDAEPSEKLPLNTSIVIGIAGMFLFLASQISIVTGAAIWSIGEYFHLGPVGFSILCAIFVPLALLACAKILILTIAAERDPENN